MIRASEDHGFTLIELLVTMALAIVVFGATLTVLEVFQRNNTYAQERNENQDNARSAMDRISRTLRNVIVPSETYAGSLEQGNEDSLMFQTVDTSSFKIGKGNKSHAMRVRYCLDTSTPTNETLWEQSQEWEETEPKQPTPTACPDRTAGVWTNTRQLVQHVTNYNGGHDHELFEYSTSEAPQTLTVKTNLYLELTPGQQRSSETELTSAVSLRNANRKPVAAFTVTAEAGKYEYRFNASESYDPGGLALTYKWWENGTLLTSTSQVFTVTLSAKTKYNFKLQVTNPGGLSTETEREVTTP